MFEKIFTSRFLLIYVDFEALHSSIKRALAQIDKSNNNKGISL
ncbi:hypothetical protein FM107_10055 [Sphingobacterium sp. JB170]|nr:hypothetical protein FM107_10055 [Sphingobacterium sp. JB170]